MVEDYDNYPPPNDVAKANAAEAMARLHEAGFAPDGPEDDVLGGLGIYLWGDRRYVWIATMNNGYVGAVMSRFPAEPDSRPITDWPDAITRFRAFLAS